MRNIGQDRIRSIIVPECSSSEQQEIVRLLEEQFEIIEQNEREIDAEVRRFTDDIGARLAQVTRPNRVALWKFPCPRIADQPVPPLFAIA